MNPDDVKPGDLIAYTIRLIPETGELEMNTSRVHNDFLWYLSEHGGECYWNPDKVRPEVQAHMEELWPIGVVTLISVVGSKIVRVKLTPLGIRAVDAIRKSRAKELATARKGLIT